MKFLKANIKNRPTVNKLLTTASQENLKSMIRREQGLIHPKLLMLEYLFLLFWSYALCGGNSECLPTPHS